MKHRGKFTFYLYLYRCSNYLHLFGSDYANTEIYPASLDQIILSTPGQSVIHYALTCNKKKKLRGFGPLANHADRATAASWRSSTNFCG
jgi:hypothetical protein